MLDFTGEARSFQRTLKFWSKAARKRKIYVHEELTLKTDLDENGRLRSAACVKRVLPPRSVGSAALNEDEKDDLNFHIVARKFARQ